jgi:hypothetical protein
LWQRPGAVPGVRRHRRGDRPARAAMVAKVPTV